MTPQKRHRGFAGHAATYAIGNVARRVVGFIMLPIYTRFLSPADYGVIGLLTFALFVFEPLIGARLGAAIPKFYAEAPDARAKRAVIWSAIGFTGSVSTVSVAIIVVLRGVGSELLFGSRQFAFALGLYAVTFLSQPIEQAGMVYLRLRQRSGLFLGFSMVKLVLQIALNVLLVVIWREGVLGVVLSAVISSVLLSVATTTYVAAKEPPAFDWETTRGMVRFCWPLWLSGLAGLYIGSSGNLYLRVFGSLSDVGLLSLALRFASVVGMLIWSPFYRHWEPMSFQYYREEGARRKFQVAFISISALMFAGGLGISIFASPVIRIMAAKSFDAAAPLVPVLVFGAVVTSLRQFFNFSFFVTGNTKIHSLCQYGAALIITVTYVLFIPKFGLMGAAVAQTLALTINFLYVRILSRRYFDPGISLVPMGLFALIGVVAYLCSNVLLRAPSLALDLLVRSFVMLVAMMLLALVALREIRGVAGPVEALPWPLDRLARIQFGRQSGT